MRRPREPEQRCCSGSLRPCLAGPALARRALEGSERLRRGLPLQTIRNRSDLLKQAVEHQLGVGVDAPFGQAALGVDAVEALLEHRGALLEAADPAAGAFLGFSDAGLDVAA